MSGRGWSIAFFGSSPASAYWNGAATYCRGIMRALAARGHRITLYEPDTGQRQAYRDLSETAGARVDVYDGDSAAGIADAVEEASDADLIVKASGIGVFDEWLERAVLDAPRRGAVAFWDVDPAATLDRVLADPDDPLRALVPRYDLVLTYGGGEPVVSGYADLGARRCAPVYDALDPRTHHPVLADTRYVCDLAFLGNRMPDREARVERMFLQPARRLPDSFFLLGGSGWEHRALPANVAAVGHVFTRDHNAFHVSPRAVLNLSRNASARYGFSPPTRVFEAAGAGACLITDAWDGIEMFLEPDAEVLVARDGDDVAAHVDELTPARAAAIGMLARRRILAEHTYAHRARQVEETLGEVGLDLRRGAA